MVASSLEDDIRTTVWDDCREREVPVYVRACGSTQGRLVHYRTTDSCMCVCVCVRKGVGPGRRTRERYRERRRRGGAAAAAAARWHIVEGHIMPNDGGYGNSCMTDGP